MNHLATARDQTIDNLQDTLQEKPYAWIYGFPERFLVYLLRFPGG